MAVVALVGVGVEEESESCLESLPGGWERDVAEMCAVLAARNGGEVTARREIGRRRAFLPTSTRREINHCRVVASPLPSSSSFNSLGVDSIARNIHSVYCQKALIYVSFSKRGLNILYGGIFTPGC